MIYTRRFGWFKACATRQTAEHAIRILCIHTFDHHPVDCEAKVGLEQCISSKTQIHHRLLNHFRVSHHSRNASTSKSSVNDHAGFAFKPNCTRNLSRLAASLPVRSASSWLKISLIWTTVAISQRNAHQGSREEEHVQVSLAMSLEVSGNFSIGFPLLRDTMGARASSALVTLLLATRETLLVFLVHDASAWRRR